MNKTAKAPLNVPVGPNGEWLRCQDCMHSNRECDRCIKKGIRISKAMYACATDFATREDEIARLQAKKEELARRMERRLNFLLTAMCNSSTATSLLLEDFDSRFEDTKAERKWRQERKMAYNKIREHMESARKLYNQYIQKDLDNLFTDRGTKEYDVKMYDHHTMDAMEWCRLQLLYTDRCWDNEKNANKVMGFIESLPSSDIFDDSDIEHYRMRR